MNIKKNNCTEEIVGKIINLKSKGLDNPTLITVQYIVNGQSYEVTESSKLKSEAIKFGFLPIGQRQVPVMGDTSVGSSARVRYNSADPGEAYLYDNIGVMNC